MAEGRSKEAAWGVVRAAWEEQSREDDGQSLGLFEEQEIAHLFGIFWDTQFEDDRTAVRSDVGSFVDLILNAHASDED